MRDVLVEWKFNLAGTIGPKGAHLGFHLAPDYYRRKSLAKLEGWVYAWVLVDQAETQFDVCYIGKAGARLLKRCGQHTQGFKGGSKRGLDLAKDINKHLNSAPGNRIEIHARHSEPGVVMKETISMCGAEETAMITKFIGLGVKLWNK